MRKSRKSIRQLDTIWKRDRFICHLCIARGLTEEQAYCSRDEASRDRIIPRTKGGKYTYHNLKLAHRRCNSARGDKPIEEYVQVVDYHNSEAYLHQQLTEKEYIKVIEDLLDRIRDLELKVDDLTHDLIGVLQHLQETPSL